MQLEAQSRTRRFRTSRLAAIAAGAAIVLSAAPALAGGPSHNHRYADGFACKDLYGGRFHAGVIVINGWAYDLDTRSVKRDIVKAFRNAGYNATIIGYRVDVCTVGRRAPRVSFIAGRMDSLISCGGSTLTVKPIWADAHDRGVDRDHRTGRGYAHPAPVVKPVSRPVYRAPRASARPTYKPARWGNPRRGADHWRATPRIDPGFTICIGDSRFGARWR